MNDDALARWRSWLDKDHMPEGWHRNLWDEFYALQHRRDTWRGYREMLLASPEDAQHTARWLTQVVTRNHVETQAMAIRRIADPGRDPRVVSLGRILREIAMYGRVLGDEFAREADDDLVALTSAATSAKLFADKLVAHLDHDHASAVPPLALGDLDSAIDYIGRLWQRWYTRVTGKGVSTELPPPGWPSFLRLQRVPGPSEGAQPNA
jgi:hypothetical protein